MNDQNEMGSKDFDWFSSTIQNSVRDIRQVLLVLSPWDDPMPIKRKWGLFQIHNALQRAGANLFMYVSLREVEELRSGVIEGSKFVIQALSDI